MKDYNSPEEVAKRANQEDPIIMYLIVRKSLEMSPGKLAAQCAHAAQMLLLKYMDFKMGDLVCSRNISKILPSTLGRGHKFKYHPTFSREQYELFQEWLDGSFRKVVLKADEKQWRKLKESDKRQMVLVIDAGLTELEPSTETVIGLAPMRKSEAPKLVQRLRVL